MYDFVGNDLKVAFFLKKKKGKFMNNNIHLDVDSNQYRLILNGKRKQQLKFATL